MYRSSYKNAMRLTRTETNMAYKTAEQDRWQRMDFVVGYEVKRSKRGFDCSICESLKGKFPKDFVFRGWHPQCRCYIVPILAEQDEFVNIQKKILDGEDISNYHYSNKITEVPKQFNRWIESNKERIEKASSLPYFIKDNFIDGNVNKGLRFVIIKPNINTLDITTKKPHKAIKTSYTNNSQLNDTFKEINSEFSTNKWFENGDMDIYPTNEKWLNGSTNMKGVIKLKPDRLNNVKSAMGKIGSAKSAEITFDEADAMATLWHEITHNRNKHGGMYLTNLQRDVMEMMNEFVARKTLPEFYAKLGCNKTPHPEFINNRNSTGYNNRVLGYDFVIQKLGLNPAKVLESAKKNLFALKYTEQETTAIQALLDGGLDKFKRVDGKPIGKAQLKKIVVYCRNGANTTTLENYMKNEGIIS